MKMLWITAESDYDARRALARWKMCQTDRQELVDEGFEEMKALADDGDMTAAAEYGRGCSFAHTGHCSPDDCAEYLHRSADSGDALGQYYIGTMLLRGEDPFARDSVLGLDFIRQAAAAGNEDAEALLKRRSG